MRPHLTTLLLCPGARLLNDQQYWPTTAPLAQVEAFATEVPTRTLPEEWEETGPLKVRMALHTGTAEERVGDYFRPTISRVARLLSAGHGGQILLSRTTQEVVRDQLLADDAQVPGHSRSRCSGRLLPGEDHGSSNGRGQLIPSSGDQGPGRRPHGGR